MGALRKCCEVAIFSLGSKTLRLKAREVNPKSKPKHFVKFALFSWPNHMEPAADFPSV
jgi:hypothetical protein